MTTSTHQHSSLRAIGVDIACFAVGLVALMVGYYIAGWLGAVVTAGLAVAAIMREARRPRGPGVGTIFIVVMVALLAITFGYRILGWPAVVLVPVIAAIGVRERERRPYTELDTPDPSVLSIDSRHPFATSNPGNPLNPYDN